MRARKWRGNARHLKVDNDKLVAASLSGDISAQAWLREYLENEQSVVSLGRLLLMPSSKAPQGFRSRGRIVCNCLNVSEAEIETALQLQGLLCPGGGQLALPAKILAVRNALWLLRARIEENHFCACHCTAGRRLIKHKLQAGEMCLVVKEESYSKLRYSPP